MNKREQKFTEMKIDYMKTSLDHIKKEKRDKIYNRYLSLNLKDRNEIKEIIYPVLRDYLQENLLNSNYEGVISSFKEIRSTNRYQNEFVANKAIVQNILLKAYLYLCLEKDDNLISFINEVKILLDSLENLLQTKKAFTKEQYENESRAYNENLNIYKSLLSGDFWTEIQLTLPFPIGISEEYLDLNIFGQDVQLKTEKFKCNSSLINVDDNSVLQLSFDKYGLLTKTKVTLKMKKYLSEKSERLYFFGEKEERSTILIYSLNILNEVISRYRLFNNNYWIDNIDARMIEVSSVKFYASGIVVKNIIAQSENTYKITQNYDYNSVDENKILQENLFLNKDDYLWQELLADAKSFLLVNKLREAIISLNSSFENFFYTKFQMILCKYDDIENIELFFSGEQMYNDFGSRDLINEELFEILKSRNALPSGVPSVYQIVKKYYKVVPQVERITYSKRQFEKSIKKIREYRNDIVHGNLHIELSTKHVFEAIQEFEEICLEIERIHF